MLRQYWKPVSAITALAFAAGATFVFSGERHHASLAGPVTLEHLRAGIRPMEAYSRAQSVDFASAVADKSLTAEFKGNGREKMVALFSNNTLKRARFHLKEGQIFQSGNSCVVLLYPCEFELGGGESCSRELQTAAARSANSMGPADYRLASYTLGNLDALVAALQNRQDASEGAIQTAILALTENLPVAAFAKFPEPGSDLPTKFDTSAFKVEVADIVSALALLREIGCPEDQIALSIDPQLKIEAMIDPLAHAVAMQYYKIPAQAEWDYWKHELLQGEEGTRHYALYGIARFFPGVALDMLPRWARESRTSEVFRVSAVQALALTGRPEALSALRQIEHELNGRGALGLAARNAADVLDAKLASAGTSGRRLAIAFRSQAGLPPQM